MTPMSGRVDGAFAARLEKLVFTSSLLDVKLQPYVVDGHLDSKTERSHHCLPGQGSFVNENVITRRLKRFVNIDEGVKKLSWYDSS